MRYLTKTKIPWCDYTWNPVVGCLNLCPYCYAHRINHRFAKTSEQRKFLPTFHEERLDVVFPKQPATIFVGSMSDIMWWKPLWIHAVLDVIMVNPQHCFIFLTKGGYATYHAFPFMPENVICGVTVTYPDNIQKPEVPNSWHTLLNLEPLQKGFASYSSLVHLHHYDWIIVGAETGNRQGRFIPAWPDIRKLLAYTINNDIPTFVKPSLQSITPIDSYKQDRIFPFSDKRSATCHMNSMI